MHLHNSLHIEYHTEILDGEGRTVSSRPPKRNLLLDSGLDNLAGQAFWFSFSNVVLGTGTAPTKRDSGAATVTISGEVATASANFFQAGDVGRLLKVDSGQEVYISGYTSETEVAVAGAADEAASEFTIWYVNATGHETEVRRISTVSATDSSWNGTQAMLSRTFTGPVESTARTYREIGWSGTSTVGNNLLGRDLIPGGGDSIAPGQQYRVTVRFFIGITPIEPTAFDNVGGGFDLGGTAMFARLHRAFLGPSNSSIFITSGDTFFDPDKTRQVSLYDAALDMPSAPSIASNASDSARRLNLTKAGYVAKSFRLVESATFGTSQGNGTVAAVAVGAGSSTNWHLNLTTPQSKASTHTLAMSYTHSWGRTLVN